MLDLLHRTKKAFGSHLVTAMQGLKQLLEPFEQTICPSGQFFNALFGKETNLPDKMSHTILHTGIKQTGVFTIGAPIVRTNNTGKITFLAFFADNSLGRAANYWNLNEILVLWGFKCAR
jgi:hypothetical protein